MTTPEMQKVRAIDVVPYEWAVWCSIEGGPPFENEICGVRWSDDSQHLWFMMESHNFLKARPDEVLELVPWSSRWRTPEMQEKTRAEHRRIIDNPPRMASCVTCRGELRDALSVSKQGNQDA